MIPICRRSASRYLYFSFCVAEVASAGELAASVVFAAGATGVGVRGSACDRMAALYFFLRLSLFFFMYYLIFAISTN